MQKTFRSSKLFAGARLRVLRKQAGLSQVAVARAVGVSPSYLNQIEQDQRPLPDHVLHALCALFGVGSAQFGDSEALQQAQDLREATSDAVFGQGAVSAEEAHLAAQAVPGVSQRFLALYRTYLAQKEELQALRESRGGGEKGGGMAAPLAPYEEIRDWVQTRHNYFDALDHAAERLFEDAGFNSLTLREDLVRRLRDTHGIVVEDVPTLLEQGMMWRLMRREKRLLLAESAPWESRVFWIAHVIGLLEYGRAIDREITRAGLSTPEARALGRVSIANYFAGALMMPYGRFLEAARAMRYDAERLQGRFGASFEQACHRISTLQRPGAAGVPFYFLKTDIAGNLLKRSNATRFQFARFGTPCPLWNVYRAFAHPGQIHVQLARMPDETTYLTVARTVSRSGGFHFARPRSVAVGLGCEVQHAAEVIYATGLDLHSPEAAVPIGPGCRSCERVACRHRAVPPLGQMLDVGGSERGMIPYRIHLPVHV